MARSQLEEGSGMMTATPDSRAGRKLWIGTEWNLDGHERQTDVGHPSPNNLLPRATPPTNRSLTQKLPAEILLLKQWKLNWAPCRLKGKCIHRCRWDRSVDYLISQQLHEIFVPIVSCRPGCICWELTQMEILQHVQNDHWRSKSKAHGRETAPFWSFSYSAFFLWDPLSL